MLVIGAELKQKAFQWYLSERGTKGGLHSWGMARFLSQLPGSDGEPCLQL